MKQNPSLMRDPLLQQLTPAPPIFSDKHSFYPMGLVSIDIWKQMSFKVPFTQCNMLCLTYYSRLLVREGRLVFFFFLLKRHVGQL